MTEAVHNHSSNSNTAAAETQTVFTPEQVVEQLRVLRASIPYIAPLTGRERRVANRFVSVTPEVLQAQIAVIGASSTITTALGSSAGDAQQMAADDSRWSLVEAELQALLTGVSGGNIMRRQKLRLLAAKGYGMGALLVRGSDDTELKPHVDHVRQIKRAQRRSKPATDPTPSPAPQQPAGA